MDMHGFTLVYIYIYIIIIIIIIIIIYELDLIPMSSDLGQIGAGLDQIRSLDPSAQSGPRSGFGQFGVKTVKTVSSRG